MPLRLKHQDINVDHLLPSGGETNQAGRVAGPHCTCVLLVKGTLPLRYLGLDLAETLWDRGDNFG